MIIKMRVCLEGPYEYVTAEDRVKVQIWDPYGTSTYTPMTAEQARNMAANICRCAELLEEAINGPVIAITKVYNN